MKKSKLSLICLHGFMGSKNDWDSIRLHLDPSIELHSFDLPYHGTQTQTTSSWQECLSFLKEQISIIDGPKALWGYSQGGRLALSLAISFPKLIDYLILESCHYGLTDEEKVGRSTFDANLFNEVNEDDQNSAKSFLQSWYELDLFNGIKDHPAYESMLERRLKSFNINNYKNSLNCMGAAAGPNHLSDLKLLNIPTLLLAGKRDTKYCKVMETIHSKVPDSRLEHFEASHNPHFERPFEVSNSVTDFILKG